MLNYTVNSTWLEVLLKTIFCMKCAITELQGLTGYQSSRLYFAAALSYHSRIFGEPKCCLSHCCTVLILFLGAASITVIPVKCV